MARSSLTIQLACLGIVAICSASFGSATAEVSANNEVARSGDPQLAQSVPVVTANADGRNSQRVTASSGVAAADLGSAPSRAERIRRCEEFFKLPYVPAPECRTAIVGSAVGAVILTGAA